MQHVSYGRSSCFGCCGTMVRDHCPRALPSWHVASIADITWFLGGTDIVDIKHIMLPPRPREFKDIYVVFELMETDLHQVSLVDPASVELVAVVPFWG